MPAVNDVGEPCAMRTARTVRCGGGRQRVPVGSGRAAQSPPADPYLWWGPASTGGLDTGLAPSWQLWFAGLQPGSRWSAERTNDVDVGEGRRMLMSGGSQTPSLSSRRHLPADDDGPASCARGAQPYLGARTRDGPATR